MRSIHTKIVSIVLLAAMLFSMVGPGVAFAQEIGQPSDDSAAVEGTGYEEVVQKELTSAPSSACAPEGYVPRSDNDVPLLYADINSEESGKKVLLIQDVLPWDSDANTQILGKITSYTKVTTSGFLNVDLSEYSVVVFANDQPFDTYENYTEFKEYLELFAELGGVIVFGACDSGWSQGQMNAALPGDVIKIDRLANYNYITKADHPIVSGSLTDNTPLSDDDLYSNYCSHVAFDESTFPAGTTVILRDSDSKLPTLIEYPLGKGRVIASGLTWEHNYVYGGESAGHGWGAFAAESMEDMFRYAIRVSNIDVDDLFMLDDWKVKYNAHTVIAADADSGVANMAPVVGAQVKIDTDTYTTDAEGAAYHYEYGVQTVTVSAENFRTRTVQYNLKSHSSRIFFLERDKGDGLPYVVQATGKDGSSYYDLRDEAVHYLEGSNLTLHVTFKGEWNGHGAGKYVLYQENGKSINIPSYASAKIAPGQEFKADRPILLKLIAEDGTESEPIVLNILVEKKTNTSNSGNSATALKEGTGKFDWFLNQAVSSDNEVFTKFLTLDLSIASDLLPFEMVVDHNDDGTVTYRAVIGLVSGNKTKNILNNKSDKIMKDDGVEIPVAECWETWKSEIKNFKKAGDAKTYFTNLKTKYGKDWHGTRVRAAAEFDGDVAGYLEVKVNPKTGEVVESEGGIIVEASGEYVRGRTFMAGPCPVYYELKPGLGLKSTLGVNVKDGKFSTSFKGVELSVPKIGVGGGVGVRNVATAGVEGGGALVVGFGGENGNTGKLDFYAKLTIKVIFVINYDWQFAQATVPLWPKEKAVGMDSQTLYSSGQAEAVITLADREYQENLTLWNGGEAAVMSLEETALATLQEGVMPDAMPEIYQVGDRLVMLMLRDVESRATGNNTQLVYSVYENGAWSEPAAVMESETADFFFDGRVINDELYVAWQKSTVLAETENAEELLTQIVAGSEIYVARWDDEQNAFTEHWSITSNDTLDMMPALVESDGEVLVAWVNNDANDLFGSAGTNTIYQAAPGGEAVAVAQSEGYFSELVAAEIENGIEYLYTVMNAAGETSMYHLADGEAQLIEAELPMGLSVENGVFLWQDNGNIHTYDAAADNHDTLVSNEVSASYRYVSNGKDTALVWLSSEDSGTTVKASMYMDGVWCDPVTLLEGIEEAVSFYDISLLDDGKFAMVFNTYISGDEGYEYTALKYAVVQPETDAALHLAELSTANWSENTQELRIGVENLGAVKIPELEVTVTTDDGTLLTQTIKADLLPGEIGIYALNLDLSGLTGITKAFVSVDAEGDQYTANNGAVIMLGTVDVSLDYDVYYRGDERLFVFTVTNSSNIPCNAALSIFQNSLDGIELNVKNIGVVTNEESVQYLYSVDTTKIEYDENGLMTYYFQVETLEEDWNYDDNVCSFTFSQVVYDEPDPEDEIVEVEYVAGESVEITNGDIVFKGPGADSLQLEAKVMPENATTPYVEWSVEDADIVHITSDGVLTPLRPGSTTVTATLEGTYTATIHVVVLDDTVEHIPGEWVVTVEPTCTENGEQTRTCSCGDVETQVIPALGHDHVSEVTKPTCTEQGYTTYDCSRCGDSYVADYVDALGHHVVLVEYKSATCELNGYEYYACDRCGGQESQIILEAIGHDYQDGACSSCGEEDPDAVDPEEPGDKPGWSSWWDKIFGSWWGKEECDHEYTSVITEATCEDKGYTTHTCGKCGDSYKDSYVDALGHSFVNGTCTVCGKKETSGNKPGWGIIWDWIFGWWN